MDRNPVWAALLHLKPRPSLCQGEVDGGHGDPRRPSVGLTMDPVMAAQYGTLPAEYALDAIRQSWTPADGPPHLRPIAAGSEVANSVAVRVQYALTYTPGNLTLQDGPLLGDGYSIVSVVTEGLQ